MRVLAELQLENAMLREDIRRLAERVSICSGLLGKRAERQADADCYIGRTIDGILTVSRGERPHQPSELFTLTDDELQWLSLTLPAVVGASSVGENATSTFATPASGDDSGKCDHSHCPHLDMWKDA